MYRKRITPLYHKVLVLTCIALFNIVIGTYITDIAVSENTDPIWWWVFFGIVESDIVLVEYLGIKFYNTWHALNNP